MSPGLPDKEVRRLTNQAVGRAFDCEMSCPECQSRDIGSMNDDDYSVAYIYRCFDCGHEGNGRLFRRPKGALRVLDEKAI